MSATLQQGLASLLVRRTEEGRAKALHGIEAWQKAIEAVRQAERMAQHKINLPNEQVQGVQQAAAQVRTANYVQAVYLTNKATTARNAIIATASRALEEETKHRHRLETTARQEIYTAINERDNAITAAKTQLDAKSREIQSEMEKENREAKHFSTLNFVGSLFGLYIIASATYGAVKAGAEGGIPYRCINFRLPGDVRRLARPGGAAQLLSSLLIFPKGWISPVVMSSATLQARCNPVFYALS